MFGEPGTGLDLMLASVRCKQATSPNVPSALAARPDHNVVVVVDAEHVVGQGQGLPWTLHHVGLRGETGILESF